MGFRVKEIPYGMKVGRDLKSVSNLVQTCKEQEQDFDFALVDIFHSNNYRTEHTINSRDIAMTRSGRYHYHSSLTQIFYRHLH